MYFFKISAQVSGCGLAVRRRRRAARALGELQSAAVGRRRTARFFEPQKLIKIYVTFCAAKR